MSICVLIISFICLYFSIKSMRSWFKSSKQIQEEFLKSLDDGIKASDEKSFTSSFLLFGMIYTIIWVWFYMNVYNVFNYGGLVILSLIAVFYILQTVYNFFRSLGMLIKKEIKVSLVGKVLNTIELVYIICFIYYYVITRMGSLG